jgi:ABC-type transporter Mla subunit MlaD
MFNLLSHNFRSHWTAKFFNAFSLKGFSRNPVDSSMTAHPSSSTDENENEKACSFAAEKDIDQKMNAQKECNDSMSGLIQSLSTLADALNATVKNVESPFLQLGSDLQGVYGDATELTQNTLDTVKLLGTESDAGILSRLDSLINDALAALDTSHTTADIDLKLIDSMVGDLKRLYNLCDKADEIAKFLQMIGFNILIQSSESQEYSQLFSFIAQESKEFSHKIFKIASNVRDDAQNAIVDQVSIHGRVDDNLIELRRLADDARLLVRNAFEEIERIISFSSNTLAQANTYTSEISSQIGEIVMGIQLHDNVNQRIEHIVTAICEVEETLNPETPDSEVGGSEAERTGYVASLLNLQIAQLQQVITEIEVMHQKSRQAFESIGTVAERLMDNLTAISPGSNNSSSALTVAPDQDPFATLNAALLHLHELLARGDGLTEQIQETTAHASQKVTLFSNHMEQIRQISHDTLLIALNAIINASHLGAKGAVFGVMAKELKDLSDNSNLFVMDVESIIQAITASVRDGQSTDESDTASTDASYLKTAIEEISCTYSTFRDNCAAVSGRAGVLQTTLSRIGIELDFLPSLVKRLQGHLNELQEIHQQLCDRIDPEALLSTDTMDRLAARYTMQQERDIHEQGAANPQNQDEGDVLLFDQNEPAAEDDFGDNFELF